MKIKVVNLLTLTTVVTMGSMAFAAEQQRDEQTQGLQQAVYHEAPEVHQASPLQPQQLCHTYQGVGHSQQVILVQQQQAPTPPPLTPDQLKQQEELKKQRAMQELAEKNAGEAKKFLAKVEQYRDSMHCKEYADVLERLYLNANPNNDVERLSMEHLNRVVREGVKAGDPISLLFLTRSWLRKNSKVVVEAEQGILGLSTILLFLMILKADIYTTVSMWSMAKTARAPFEHMYNYFATKYLNKLFYTKLDLETVNFKAVVANAKSAYMQIAQSGDFNKYLPEWVKSCNIGPSTMTSLFSSWGDYPITFQPLETEDIKICRDKAEYVKEIRRASINELFAICSNVKTMAEFLNLKYTDLVIDDVVSRDFTELTSEEAALIVRQG